MIYPALVLETSGFTKTGTIRVRVAQYYNKNMVWDLSAQPDFIEQGVNKDTGSHNDYEAYVFSPIGGGSNYGMFFLPQVNTTGLIAFMGNPFERGSKCFWLGSFFEPTFAKNGKLESINFPTDLKSASASTNGYNYQTLTMEDEDLSGALIIRLKSTKYNKEETDNDKKKSALNWKKSNSENLIVVNKDRIRIHHSVEYDDNGVETAYNELLIDNNNITVKATKTKDEKERYVSFNLNRVDDDLTFDLKTEDVGTKFSNEIIANKNGINLTSTLEDKTANVLIANTGVAVTAKENTLLIDDKGVTINAENSSVYVVAKDVHLGKEDSRVLTTTFNGTYELPNGMIIKSSDSVYA